jgi:NADP-dependent 3-hydroxy acid dehydrogenase YdfG
VNNAGVMMLGAVDTQDPKEWETMISVNISGVINGVRVVLKTMKDRNSGTVINISSIAGIKPFPNHAV